MMIDITPSMYHYDWKEWLALFLLPPSENSFGTVIAFNEYVPTSGRMFKHFDTSFDPYFNDDLSHFRYGDSIMIEQYHYKAQLSNLDMDAMTE